MCLFRLQKISLGKVGLNKVCVTNVFFILQHQPNSDLASGWFDNLFRSFGASGRRSVRGRLLSSLDFDGSSNVDNDHRSYSGSLHNILPELGSEQKICRLEKEMFTWLVVEALGMEVQEVFCLIVGRGILTSQKKWRASLRLVLIYIPLTKFEEGYMRC